MTFFQQVYGVVRKIPRGRVMTYGDVAKILRTESKRAASGSVVGWALHANRDPETPCHRVVFVDGSLTAGYVFGGAGKQREKLEAEGVKFTDEGKVDFKECRAAFPTS